MVKNVDLRRVQFCFAAAALFHLASLRVDPGCAAQQQSPAHSTSFELHRNLIFVPVRVNGAKPLAFVLDTGCADCLIDQARARELRLRLEPGGKGVGIGDTPYDFQSAKNVSLAFAGIDLAVPSAAVVDLSSMQHVLGRPVDGALGYDVFASYVVAVDYEKHRLSFHDPDTYAYEGRGEKIALRIERNVPFAAAQLKVFGHDQVSRMFLIDTGYTRAVSDELIAKTTSRKLAVTTVGLGQERKGFAARVEKLQLGKFTIENAVGRTGRSIIGGEILSRFNIVFDYSRRQMILEPNARLGEPFPFDASGLTLQLVEETKQFRIIEVRADSPAADAGLRAGDIILAIDGRPAAKWTLAEVQTLLQHPGKQHRLEMRRGDKQWQVTIKLRELL
jgi:hypothetical protein